jgi:CRISPR-associated protein Cas2
LLKDGLEKIMDKEKDSIRYYFLGANWQRRVEHTGAKETYDPEEPMIM